MGTLAKNTDLFPRVPSLFDDFFTRDFFSWPDNNFTTQGTLPDVNVKETPDAFELEVAAPGMSKSDIHVELEDNMLVISGEKKQEEKTDDGYMRREFNYHTFRRSFVLPEKMVNGDDIKAKYDNGILYITVPKSEEAKVKPVKQIEIH